MVETLDRIFCLIGKQRISYQAAAHRDTLWNPGNFLTIVWQFTKLLFFTIWAHSFNITKKACFSIKTLPAMYKQIIYSWQKIIKITWLKYHKQQTLFYNLCNKDCKDKTKEKK